jgi:hypothetical protein
MQKTAPQTTPMQARESLLRAVTVSTLVVLIIEYIVGEITNLCVTLPSTHAGTISSGSPDFLTALGWALLQSGIPLLQVHAAIGLLLVLLALTLLVLAILRRQGRWVSVSVFGGIGVLIGGASGVGFVITGGDEVASLVMALAFMLALIVYSLGLYLTRTR